LLVLLACAVTTVTLLRRQATPWARSIKAYFALAACVIGIRVFFQVLLGGAYGQTVLFTLPQLPLPGWAAGVTVGGAVTLEGVLAAVYDALRLAVMLLCLGAANALANPRQALRTVPAALYEVSVAVVIALSVAPQLVESVQRVAKARRLRGHRPEGLRGLLALVVPVLADAIDRSTALATSMQARGFGRRAGRSSPWPTALMLASAMAATLGAFLLLGGWPWPLAAALLALGVVGTLFGLRGAGRRLRVTRHNPPRWGLAEWWVTACGVSSLAAATALGVCLPQALQASVYPLAWPQLSPWVWAVLGPAAAALAFTGEEPAALEPDQPIGGVRRLRPLPEQAMARLP
ncbi:MAG: energy-coupling factor transporter transmembrane protein EcfT, partial [Propionibacteriaceae bacterium]|nr:energy-coupling factor transporter transmembrane protein EcfT [Propionibacteriaceae bacterium]